MVTWEACGKRAEKSTEEASRRQRFKIIKVVAGTGVEPVT